MADAPGDLAVIGDKPKAQLSRTNTKDFKVSFSSVGKDVPTFAEASAIADEIMKNGGDWDEVSHAPGSQLELRVYGLDPYRFEPLPLRAFLRSSDRRCHLGKSTTRGRRVQAIRDGG